MKKRRGRPPKIKEELDYVAANDAINIKEDPCNVKEPYPEEKVFETSVNVKKPIPVAQPANLAELDSENSTNTVELVDSLLKDEQEQMQLKHKKHKHKDRKHNENCKKHSRKKRT